MLILASYRLAILYILYIYYKNRKLDKKPDFFPDLLKEEKSSQKCNATNYPTENKRPQKISSLCGP
jgi:hypothetical protein